MSPALLEGSIAVEIVRERSNAEIPVVSKEARIVEEVSLGKEVEYREETINDTVRKTEVDIETAHAAHIPIIAVTYGYSKTPLAELKPQGLTGNFSEVPKLVKQLAEMPGAKICAP